MNKKIIIVLIIISVLIIVAAIGVGKKLINEVDNNITGNEDSTGIDVIMGLVGGLFAVTLVGAVILRASIIVVAIWVIYGIIFLTVKITKKVKSKKQNKDSQISSDTSEK